MSLSRASRIVTSDVHTAKLLRLGNGDITWPSWCHDDGSKEQSGSLFDLVRVVLYRIVVVFLSHRFAG